MNREELAPWIERLNAELDGKKRNEIVAELCKEKSLKIGDAWKLLKEAGFDPKARPEKPEGARTNPGADTAAQGDLQAGVDPGTAPEGQEANTEPALLRHKTQYPKYRCAGLVLTQKPEAYRVTEAQMEKLRRDPWVVIEKEPAQK